MLLESTCEDNVEDSNLPILTFMPVENGTNYDDKVLSFYYYQAHKVSEIAEHWGKSNLACFRKLVLGNLAKRGYLEESKLGRAMYFKTNPDLIQVNKALLLRK